jgi:hypothetical protein
MSHSKMWADKCPLKTSENCVSDKRHCANCGFNVDGIHYHTQTRISSKGYNCKGIFDTEAIARNVETTKLILEYVQIAYDSMKVELEREVKALSASDLAVYTLKSEEYNTLYICGKVIDFEEITQGCSDSVKETICSELDIFAAEKQLISARNNYTKASRQLENSSQSDFKLPVCFSS